MKRLHLVLVGTLLASVCAAFYGCGGGGGSNPSPVHPTQNITSDPISDSSDNLIIGMREISLSRAAARSAGKEMIYRAIIYIDNNEQNLGALDFSIAYDPEIVKGIDVEKLDGIANDSLIIVNDESEKMMRIGLINANGIKGNGNILEMTFNLSSVEDKEIPIDLSVNVSTTSEAKSVKAVAVDGVINLR